MVMEDAFRGIIQEELAKVVAAVREEVRKAQADLPAAKAPVAPLLNMKQVAARLGVEAPTVRAYIDQGLLVGSKVRTRWMVRPEDLEAFCSSKKERAPSNDDQLTRILRRVQGA